LAAGCYNQLMVFWDLRRDYSYEAFGGFSGREGAVAIQKDGPGVAFTPLDDFAIEVRAWTGPRSPASACSGIVGQFEPCPSRAMACSPLPTGIISSCSGTSQRGGELRPSRATPT